MTSLHRRSALLERDAEVLQLRRAWESACHGHGSLWFVCAEAGGGKSRLAEEILRLAGSHVHRGAAEPVTPPEPFLILEQALPGFVPAASRGETARRTTTLLEALPSPLLLLFEDLHFADEGTVAVLVRLAMLCAARPWLILATFRPGEGTELLHTVATELVAKSQAGRLDLPPLTATAVATLVSQIRGTVATTAEIERVVSESGGNPWFVEALAQGSGAVSRARDRMLLRLDRLEASAPGANAVLAALAPATRPLPQAVLASLLGGDDRTLRQTLARLRDAGVLTESQAGWGFRHELLRRSVFEAMIAADQQDAHRALALALEQVHTVGGQGDGRHAAGAAEIAMHFAEAGDARAVAWAIRAAREARAVDAHTEAFAQLERALRFEPAGEVRREAGRMASQEAYLLGRYAESQCLAEDTLAVPGDDPEVRSLLHQRAANSARLRGDLAGAMAHMDDAERELEGRPVSYQMAYVATARLLQAVVAVQPDAVERHAARARRLAAALEAGPRSSRILAEVEANHLLALIDQGDLEGFRVLERIEALARSAGGNPGDLVALLVNGYTGAVVSMFNEQSALLFERCAEAIRRHELGWAARVAVYQALEHSQVGRFEAARAALAALPDQAMDTPEYGVALLAAVLTEARAGSAERARSLTDDATRSSAFRSEALIGLARLEVAIIDGHPGQGEMAQHLYGTANRRRFARVAATAAIAMARAGRGAAPTPAWLAAAAPLRVFWDWAAAIDTDDRAALRAISERLQSIGCPYDAALALRDAGELPDAYRALNALGATTVRHQVAEQLRLSGQPVPRRTRADVARDGLTETEREVCRLVAGGARNDDVAAALGISVRTVETHLGRIYQKTGQRGRVALALWWRERSP